MILIDTDSDSPKYGSRNARRGNPMSTTVTLMEAQAKLRMLIDELIPGEEIIITENERPVAKLVGERTSQLPRPAPGLGKGSILYIAPDFDELA